MATSVVLQDSVQLDRQGAESTSHAVSQCSLNVDTPACRQHRLALLPEGLYGLDSGCLLPAIPTPQGLLQQDLQTTQSKHKH